MSTITVGNSINAQMVIGAAIAMDYVTHEAVLAPLEPDMLESMHIGRALEKARELRKNGEAVDLVSITDGEQYEMEMFQELSVCCSEYLSFAFLESAVAKTITVYRESWLRRETLHAVNVDQGDLAKALQGILERYIDMQTKDAEADVFEYDEYIRNLATDTKGQRIATGIKRIDETVGGLPLGSLSIIGARPSVGKTTLACNMAVRNLKAGKNVVLFSLEMSRNQIYDRIAAMMSGVNYGAINRHQLSLQERTKVAQGMKIMQGYPGKLTVYDNTYSVDKMWLDVARIKPEMVIVDFLQYISTSHKENRATEVAEIVRKFKQMARTFNTHVMLLSQLSRNAESEDRPTMANLKESGGIEEGGDIIMLLHRPGVRDSSKDKSYAELVVAKNKYGRVGLVVLHFDGETQRFTDGDTSA